MVLIINNKIFSLVPSCYSKDWDTELMVNIVTMSAYIYNSQVQLKPGLSNIGGGHVGAASPPHHGVVQHLVWDRVNGNVHPYSIIELK